MTTGHPDEKRSNLRSIVTRVDEGLAGLVPGATATEALLAAWRELNVALDLGPEPAIRTCPGCGKLGMRNASRCGYCWIELQPLTE